MYSSEAEAPPVTTSAINRLDDTGQATVGASWPPAGGDPDAGAAVSDREATNHARTNAARAARRARTIDDLPAGIRGAGLRCSGCLLPRPHPELNRDCMAAVGISAHAAGTGSGRPNSPR